MIFQKAKTIVSVGADFLSSWLMSTQYQAQYGVNRKPDGDWMSKHFHFESVMSITGSNADERGAIKPLGRRNGFGLYVRVNGGASFRCDKYT